MLDVTPNKPEPSGTQPWTDEEKETLRRLASRKARKRELMELFPNRSLAAIKVKLSATRRELGLPKLGRSANLKPQVCKGPAMLPKDTPPLHDNWQDGWRKAAVVANARFLEALAAA